jgi:hypothetical protein
MKRINKNKRGWIRLVEVFISIVLLAGVLLIVATNNSSSKSTIEDEITQKQIAILRDVEINNQMRSQILDIPQGSLPIEGEVFTSQLPEVSSRINALTPANLECRAKLCTLNDACIINWVPEGDIYAKSVMISADLDTYLPRQLKLFCSPKTD